MSSRIRITALAFVLVASSFFGTLVWGRVIGVGSIATGGERPVAVTVTPFRLLDTRPAPDGPIGGPAAPFQPDETRTYTAAAVGSVPADATGVVLNVTAVDATAISFLTLWPAGISRPLASTLNPFPGRITFNAATVDLSGSGQFSVYNRAGTVNVVIDVTGYLVDHNHNDIYYTKDEVNGAFGLTKVYVDYWKPVAFGHINTAGVVVNSTPGVASTYNAGSKWYEITIPGVTYTKEQYVTIVTPVTYLVPICTTSAVGGKLIVSMTDTVGTPVSADFSFVTFAT